MGKSAAMSALAHRDLAPRIQVRNATKADEAEPTRMTWNGHRLD